MRWKIASNNNSCAVRSWNAHM